MSLPISLLADSSSNLLAAREQMGFTLGFHIILACLGVGFPALMLIANYIGLRRKDPVALELAQHWSKVAAVTVRRRRGHRHRALVRVRAALARVHGSLRRGLRGAASRSRGSSSSSRRSSSTIYIFGWKRLSGWAHFWTGVPVAICGIGGAFSVVAVNSWMNQPQGFTLDSAGAVTDVDPLKVIFNPAVPLRGPAHDPGRLPASPASWSPRSTRSGCCAGRRDRHHRLGLLIPLTVGCILAPIQFVVGDTAAREIAEDQPIKFAAMECVQHDPPRRRPSTSAAAAPPTASRAGSASRGSTRSWSASAPTRR